ncbi:hypothetical protein ACNOYE_38025 [Nannocystaceae bacterium ST9]
MTSTDDNHESSGTSASSPKPSPAQALVDQLAAAFAEQIRRAMGVEIEPLAQRDAQVALAYVDHYLGQLHEEDREPIVSLVAANAGAWFGELIRREIGATWIGDGKDPRRLRLLIEPNFVHFSPVDLAYSAILVGEPEEDPRLPTGAPLDAAFHLRKPPRGEGFVDPELDSAEASLSDHAWVMQRLAEVPPLPEDQYYSLTGRYETLLLILELLAARHSSLGMEPTRYHLNDYVAALTGSSSMGS